MSKLGKQDQAPKDKFLDESTALVPHNENPIVKTGDITCLNQVINKGP